jgi:hypothetical protein
MDNAMIEPKIDNSSASVAFVLAGGYLGPELERVGLVALHRLTLEAACAPPSQ